MRRYWGLFGLLAGLLWAGVSEASLFCVVDFAGKRCQYDDLDSCRQAAGPQAGCVLNEAEIAKPFGGSPYCLVESWRTECIFQDMAACEKRATTTRTVCMANPNNNPLGGGAAPFGGQGAQLGAGSSAFGGQPPMGAGASPFGAQMPQAAGMPTMPQQPRMPPIPGAPPGFPGSTATNLPSSGGIGAGYAPSAGYWPGVGPK